MAELSSSVIHKFVDLTSEEDESKGYYSYATGIVNGNDKYVQLDGSDTVASVSLATDLSTGDRVLVYIENHTATVVGNITYPTSGRAVIEINENLLDFEELTVGNFAAIDGQFETIETNYISAMYEVVDYLLAEMITADYILADTIEANYATIYDLTVLREYVDTLEASEITVEYLETNFADLNKFNALEGTVTYLESQMITTDELEANYAKIADLNVTNENVANLTADYSDLKYVLAGYEVVEDLQSIHLTADNVVIDSAVMDTILASNAIVNDLTAGTIYTSLVKIQTAENDTSLYLNDSLIQMWEDDLVRFQAGKDATGEYGLYIWNSEGKIMFDATGATSDGIGKEVIVNDMVSDTANIAGYKLDIASVAERLNEDGSLTIEAAQVTINGSTLDAWYAEVTEATTDLGTSMTALQTEFTIVQGQVDTVVSQTEILEGEVTSLSDQYAEIVVNVDSVTTQVKDLSSDYDTLTGEYTNLTSQVASIETTVNQVDITVSSLTSNYDILAESVSSLVTTTDGITGTVTSIQKALNNIGGTQILRGTNDIQSSIFTENPNWNDASWGLLLDEEEAVSVKAGFMDVTDCPNGNIKRGAYLSLGSGELYIWQKYVPYVYGNYYAISCYVRGNGTFVIQIGINESYQRLLEYEVTNSDSWLRVSAVFCDEYDDYSYDGVTNVCFGVCGESNIQFCGMKMEIGSVATDWSEAPEDMISETTLSESIVEILEDKITLKTQSTSGGMASIVLYADDYELGEAEVVEEAATAFENDLNSGNTSRIDINAGKVVFDSNTIIINSSNFTLDSDGNVTARSMTADLAYITDSTAVDLKVTGNSSFEGILYAREIHLTPVEGYNYGAFLLFGSGVTDPDWEGINPIKMGYTTNAVGDTYTTELFTNEGFLLYSGVITNNDDEYYPSVDNKVSFDLESKGVSFSKSGSKYTLSDDHPSVITVNGYDIGGMALIYATNNSSSSDAKIVVESYSGYSVWLGVGSGGSNRGIYDSTAGAWLVYKDSSNDVYLGTSTVGSGTKPIYLSSGKPTASSSTVGSGTKPIYLSSGTLTASSSTVGQNGTPVYLDSGTLTKCSVRYLFLAGDTVSTAWYGGGYITSSATSLRFTVPICRGIISSTEISSIAVSSKGELTLRQAGSYICGSSSSGGVTPSSYSISRYNSGIGVAATMSKTTNATNNASVGIAMSSTTFAFS